MTGDRAHDPVAGSLSGHGIRPIVKPCLNEALCGPLLAAVSGGDAAVLRPDDDPAPN